jgi:hypothetical protein
MMVVTRKSSEKKLKTITVLLAVASIVLGVLTGTLLLISVGIEQIVSIPLTGPDGKLPNVTGRIVCAVFGVLCLLGTPVVAWVAHREANENRAHEAWKLNMRDRRS